MILINLLGTKHADVNLEWEVNEILHGKAKYAGAELVFVIDREEVLPYILEGRTPKGLFRLAFDEEEAVLTLASEQRDIEIQARLEAPDIVQVHYDGTVYDSRQAFAKSTDLLKPDNLYGIISLALANREGAAEDSAGIARSELLALTRFGKKKMREALSYAREVMQHVLKPKAKSENLKKALKELDIPMRSKKKKSTRKKSSSKATSPGKKKKKKTSA